MNEVAAYGGFPTRYPHWRFGMEYEQLSQELRVRPLEDLRDGHQQQPLRTRTCSRATRWSIRRWSWPTSAAHVDFFKNNFFFRATDLDTAEDDRPGMAEPRRTTRACATSRASGIEKVETFIDSLPLAREPDRSVRRRSRRAAPIRGTRTRTSRREVPRLRAKGYMEKFINPPRSTSRSRRRSSRPRRRSAKRFPEQPRARRPPLPPRPRAARTLGARRPRDHPRGGLLLRPADADEDHERRMGLPPGRLAQSSPTRVCVTMRATRRGDAFGGVRRRRASAASTTATSSAITTTIEVRTRRGLKLVRLEQPPRARSPTA